MFFPFLTRSFFFLVPKNPSCLFGQPPYLFWVFSRLAWFDAFSFPRPKVSDIVDWKSTFLFRDRSVGFPETFFPGAFCFRVSHFSGGLSGPWWRLACAAFFQLGPGLSSQVAPIRFVFLVLFQDFPV